MRELAQALKREEAFTAFLSAVNRGATPAALSGLGGVQKAQVLAAVQQETERPLFAICSDEGEARRLAADLTAFTGSRALLLTARDFLFLEAEGASRQGEQQRLTALYAMLTGSCRIIVATAGGAAQRTVPPDVLESAAFTLRAEETYDLEDLTRRLAAAGYERCPQVEGPGQFSRRGGILDFFSPGAERPVRVEFFGDEIDSMGFFDLESQRREERCDRVAVVPVRESLPTLYPGGPEALADAIFTQKKRLTRRKNLPEGLLDTFTRDAERLAAGKSLPAADRYMALLYPFACALDYLAPDAFVAVCEPLRCSERLKNAVWQTGEDTMALGEKGVLDPQMAELYLDEGTFWPTLTDWTLALLENFTGAGPITPVSTAALLSKTLPSYGGSLETAAGDIAHYIRTGFSVVVLAGDRRRAGTLKDYLDSHDVACGLDYNLDSIPPPGVCVLAEGSLSSGFELPESRLAVITEGQLLSRPFRRRVKRSAKSRQAIDSWTELSPGDLVVHETYGIGRFVGIFKKTVDKIEKDYIKIAYEGTDSLYIPATQLDVISRYIGGGEDHEPRLSKLGGGDWNRAKQRARGAVKALAHDLVALQAQRLRQPGYAFSEDTPWQREFEDAFPYQETDDQLRSIREIKEDMERPRPMDRLLCGDVGYGKTEVALRAVMKCVCDGKQAAILVPTTVLAQQHYQTAVKRFEGQPVEIRVLSRFRTPQQLRQALVDLSDGRADLVIGTHRLLQKDVQFKDLGLLVVDEEQRFGVAHKERLKELAQKVDVLTLSATPIPRTLNMALSGIRDMSTIEEPPVDRQPVQTYVMEHDWGVVCDAIRRELSRGGQVYYLHNRIENIERVAARLAGMLEGVSIAAAHGKMEEGALSSVMEAVAAGEVQVLVCTTIIETGIDIPNVNTLIIEDADKMGLAQLHQIRGRVGRSARRAYAYLTFRKGKALSEIAEKRLSAIREFAEFNSGFRIAMRDLEIRGAGNLLGAEQSGHMMNVGYDMYLKLLEEAVLTEKGEKPRVRTECSADLAVAASIPDSYVPAPEQRMDLYRRIARIRTEEDADDMTDELIDRFGDPPRCVNTLIRIALLRGEAEQAGISEITQKAGVLRFKLEDFRMETISALYPLPRYKGSLRIEAGASPALSIKLRSGVSALEEAVQFVREYTRMRENTAPAQ